MDYALLFDKIDLAQEGRTSFYQIHSRTADPRFAETLAGAFQAFDDGDEAFALYLEKFAQQEQLPVEVLNLYIYLRLCKRAMEGCRSKGIADDVFYETAQDLALASRYLQERTGIYGISQKPHRNWLRLLLTNRIYRLGRLQFELYESKYDVQLGDVKVSVGDPCLSVHIPRYASFSEELCEASYARAREFFNTYYGMETCIFFCGSWLLHPWLKDSLKPDSTIVNFQSKYKIVAKFETDNELLNIAKNIFLHICENPEDYPEDTSLRRIYKENLRNGVAMGTARGYRL